MFRNLLPVAFRSDDGRGVSVKLEDQKSAVCGTCTRAPARTRLLYILTHTIAIWIDWSVDVKIDHPSASATIEAAKLQLRSMAVTAGTTGRLVLLWAFHSGHLFHIHLAQSCVDIQSAKTILSSLSGDECAWNGSTAGVVTNAFQTAATADRVCA